MSTILNLKVPQIELWPRHENQALQGSLESFAFHLPCKEGLLY